MKSYKIEYLMFNVNLLFNRSDFFVFFAKDFANFAVKSLRKSIKSVSSVCFKVGDVSTTFHSTIHDETPKNTINKRSTIIKTTLNTKH